MSYMNSAIKTWLRRNGFRCEGTPRIPMRECNGYIERNGRKFRIRLKSSEVDIGEKIETFDRWANSTEKTISLQQFLTEYSKP